VNALRIRLLGRMRPLPSSPSIHVLESFVMESGAHAVLRRTEPEAREDARGPEEKKKPELRRNPPVMTANSLRSEGVYQTIEGAGKMGPSMHVRR